MILLKLERVSKDFGGLRAVDGIDLDVVSDTITGLVGPNGAGKTTVFNLITGFAQCSKGQIIFEGQNITDEKPHDIVRLGISRNFQANLVFKNLTVSQNLLIALHTYFKCNRWSAFLQTSRARKEEVAAMAQVEELEGIAGLTHIRNVLAGELPHGYQRMLGVTMALASKPKLLLLDEPLTGMTGEERMAALDMIKAIKKQQGITILIVEHDVDAVLRTCDRVVVLNGGKKIAEGTPQEVANDNKVVDAYLGNAVTVRRNV